MPDRAGFLACRIVAAGLGVALLLLDLPQIGASVLRLYAGAEERDAARARLLDLADDRFGDPGARIRAGIDELHAAIAPEGGPPDRDRLGAAIADLEDGLSRAPADALGWAALADARVAAGDRKDAAAALRASILLGPYEPGLELSRCALGLALWPELDAEERLAFAPQLVLAWDREPQRLVALARSSGALPVMIALAYDPVRLKGFMKALAGPR